MRFKKFGIIAVAAAFLVVAAFFVFLLRSFEENDRKAGLKPDDPNEETAETEEGYQNLRQSGIDSIKPEEVRDKDPEKEKAKDSDRWIDVNVLLSSVNRDIKIMITTTDGALISGVPFRAEILRDGEYAEYEDSDRDGIITAADLKSGKYTVKLKSEKGYITPENWSPVTVRSDISYQAVDYIRTLIRSEEEVDADSEDTAELGEFDDGRLLEAGEIDLEKGTIGIDVSKYNKDIDWEKVRDAGIEYVIIRMGYRGSSTGALVEDPYYERNLQGAKNAGLKIGVYFFTQALNETEAIEEASMVQTLISKEELSLPVFLDVESSGGRGDLVNREQRTRNIRAFIETLENAGYRAGYYANKTWLHNYIYARDLEEFPLWLAQYKAVRPTYNARYDMWQYSSKGHVDGIEGYVDLNLNVSL